MQIKPESLESKDIEIQIPVDKETGQIDLARQRGIADEHSRLAEIKKQLMDSVAEIFDAEIDFQEQREA